jgi:hypothetical protein
MTATQGIWAARATGCLIGVIAALAVLIASRPAEGGEALGAEVSVHADLNGELAISPAGPENIIHDPALRPDRPATGNVEVRNQTGLPQRIRIRALGSAALLDQSLRLAFTDRGRELRAGTLGELRHKGGGTVVLAPGESASIATTASIDANAPSGWEAVLVDVAVFFDSAAPGGSR